MTNEKAADESVDGRLVLQHDGKVYTCSRSLANLAALCRALRAPKEKPTGDDNACKLAFLLSLDPEVARGFGHPRKEEVAVVHGAQFDLDKVTPKQMASIARRVQASGLGAVCWPSHSATADAPAARLLVLYDSPCPPAEHERLYPVLLELLCPEARAATAPQRNCNRGWNLPREGVTVSEVPGMLVDWHARLAAAPPATPSSPPAPPLESARQAADGDERVVQLLASVWQRGTTGDRAWGALGGVLAGLGVSWARAEEIGVALVEQVAPTHSDPIGRLGQAYDDGLCPLGWPALRGALGENGARVEGGPEEIDRRLDEVGRLLEASVDRPRGEGGVVEPLLSEIETQMASVEDPTPPAAELRRMAGMPGGLQLGSDHEVAERVAAELGAEGAIFDEGSFWHVPAGSAQWAVVGPERLQAAVAAWDGAEYLTAANKPARYSVSAGRVQSVKTLAANLLRRPGWFENAPIGVAFSCGTFVGPDAPDGRPLTADDRVRWVLPFSWAGADPGLAATPRLDRAMAEWFDGAADAEERRTVLLEQHGLSLMGAGTAVCGAVLLLGSGANGKSVWMDLCIGQLPEGSVSALSPQELGQEQHRANLVGKLANICSEIAESDILGTGHLKAALDHNLVRAKRVYQEPFDFRPRCTYTFSANALPPTADLTKGFWRRWTAVGFPNHFGPGRADPGLGRELAAEGPGLAVAAVRAGLAAAARGRLTTLRSSDRTLAQWRHDIDPVAAWVEEQGVAPLESKQADWPEATLVYADFNLWRDAAGHRKITRRRFVQRLESLDGLEGVYRKRDGSWRLGVSIAGRSTEDGPGLRVVR